MYETNPTILADYVPLEQTAKLCRKSKRWVQREIQQRKLTVTYVGRTPLIKLASIADMLKRNEIEAVRQRRGRS
jgi:hypothetical protein